MTNSLAESKQLTTSIARKHENRFRSFNEASELLKKSDTTGNRENEA